MTVNLKMARFRQKKLLRMMKKRILTTKKQSPNRAKLVSVSFIVSKVVARNVWSYLA